jgi:BNR repeat protein
MSKRSLGLRVIVVAVLVLLAPALNGQVVPAPRKASPQNLTCSPAPCILAPVQVDTIGAEVFAMVANPNNPSELVITGPDGNCFSPGFYFSADGGATWSHSCAPVVPYLGGQVVGYDLNNTVYGGGTSENVVLYLAFSKDNGATWSNLKAVDVQPNFGILWPRMAVDTTAASPFANRLYISSVHGGVFGGSTRLHVSFSGDGGQHWAGKYLDRKQFPNGDAFPYLSVGVDGELYMTWFYCKAQYDYGPCNRRGNPILLSKSSDGGSTWSTPVVITKIDLPPDKCLYGCLPNTNLLGLAITPVSAVMGSGLTARVSVAFPTWTGTQLQIGVVTSIDGGTTFGAPVRVSNSRIGDQFLPSISAAQDGTLAVTWLDRRNDPANFKYQPFLATSKDGTNFDISQPLTLTMSDPTFGTLGPGIWTGRTFLTPWADYSTGVEHIDLGGAQF